MESNIENDVLGFDPRDLAVYSPNDAGASSSGSSILYHMRPKDSVSDDGIYRATIKIIYDPHNRKKSILNQQSYMLHDSEGYFNVVSSLTVGDKSCPIFTAWKKCHYSDKGSVLWRQAAAKTDGGKELFDNRRATYCIVQILEDKNQPELVGQYKIWKLPKAILDEINKKMAPSEESGKIPVPIMDWLFGRSIDIEVTPGPDDPNAPERKNREIKYSGEISDDVVTIINPDGTKLLNDEDQEVLDNYVSKMNKVWGKKKTPEEVKEVMDDVNADPNTVKLREIYKRVQKQLMDIVPDLDKEFGYHEWSNETKERVSRWLKTVLSGKDPAEESLAAVTDNIDKIISNDIAEASEERSSTSSEAVSNDNGADENDDLPF